LSAGVAELAGVAQFERATTHNDSHRPRHKRNRPWSPTFLTVRDAPVAVVVVSGTIQRVEGNDLNAENTHKKKAEK
jgi:hypothetical protein